MIPIDVIVSTDPFTSEPVTLAELKAWVRIDPSDTTQDDLLAQVIAMARQKFERDTGLALITRTCIAYLDDFPSGVIELPYPPVSAISSVTYTDDDGDTITLPATHCTLQSGRTRTRASLVTCFSTQWPDFKPTFAALNYDEPACAPRSVAVTYIAGYGAVASAVPSEHKGAVMSLAAHLFRNPEAAAGSSMTLVPLNYESLVETARIY